MTCSTNPSGLGVSSIVVIGFTTTKELFPVQMVAGISGFSDPVPLWYHYAGSQPVPQGDHGKRGKGVRNENRNGDGR